MMTVAFFPFSGLKISIESPDAIPNFSAFVGLIIALFVISSLTSTKILTSGIFISNYISLLLNYKNNLFH